MGAMKNGKDQRVFVFPRGQALSLFWKTFWKNWATHAVLLILAFQTGIPMDWNASAKAESFEVLSEAFTDKIKPLIERLCLDCHSASKKEGDLDLERFTSVDQVRRDPIAWQRVSEVLRDSEMPPEESKQPTPDERVALRAWVDRYLDAESLMQAGDPGPVVLRRLGNTEYGHTIRDLTGIDTIDVAKEFPVDGAAGEGFTNVGSGLVMSPGLLSKYLIAAKEVADHAMFLPDGMRFSKHTTSRDCTDDSLAAIRGFYARFTNSQGATAVNLQGIAFDTNAGGRLPLEKYVSATIEERDALSKGSRTIADVATARGLSAKYLGLLWNTLNDENASQSFVLESLRSRWNKNEKDAVGQVVTDVALWQQSLWRFASVGHIGKKNGPKGWLESVNPLVARHEMRLKLTAPADETDLTLYLSTSDAGDGETDDAAIWQQLRFVWPGRTDLPLKELRGVVHNLAAHRASVIDSVSKCLSAAAEADASGERPNIELLAQKYAIDPVLFSAWLDCLGIGTSGEVTIGSPLLTRIDRSGDYDFIKGWTGDNALSVIANSSDQQVRVPGTMKPHSIAVHPAPTVSAVVAWKSPVSGVLQLEGKIQHAHPECGNGVSWTLEVRRGRSREQLVRGKTSGGVVMEIAQQKNVRVHVGDVVAIVISPQDGNHSCDLTAIDLTIRDGTRRWDLAEDISPDILSGNPHSDTFGTPSVWHFGGEPVVAQGSPVIPSGSLLAQWRQAVDATTKENLGKEIERLLTEGVAALALDSPDRALAKELLSLRGPLISKMSAALESVSQKQATDASGSEYGLDPALFGTVDKIPAIPEIGPLDLFVQAPSTIEVRIPADLAEGAELVATGILAPTSGPLGSVQMQMLSSKPVDNHIKVSASQSTVVSGLWSDNNLRTMHSAPVIIGEGSPVREKFEKAFDDFRQLFPAALCYTKIVPVDEVVTLTLFYREDEHLQKLMLDEKQIAELNLLWKELHFVSEDALVQVDAFEQLMQFATQDADPSAFEGMRGPINERATAFRQELLDSRSSQLQAVLEFAGRAWRRPLDQVDVDQLRNLYQTLLSEELSHDAALRMLLARVLVAPAFLYRSEKAATGADAAAVDQWELATRLSYFLWSSMPDDLLMASAASGSLSQPEVLRGHMHRMLSDNRSRRLATEFGAQWLHIRDFDRNDEKSEQHFPEFSGMRADMYEESLQFLTHLVQENASVLDLFDADYTFLNESMAKYYGIPNVIGPQWRRVDGVRQYSRGGILGFASTLSKQSGASRTSPILRGNWITEVVLGEKLPKPPKNVPPLPEDLPEGLTERQLIERHSSDAACSACHRRIDPFGFALEGFDAIGRFRQASTGEEKRDTRTTLPDGTPVDGLQDLKEYLLTVRRADGVRQLCRKLLGYALGRSVQLSDRPLLEKMEVHLLENDFRIRSAFEVIVMSRQFQEIRSKNEQ